MSRTVLLSALKAIRVWIALGAVWVLFFLGGAVRGPLNYAWLFAMACWPVVDIYWCVAASKRNVSVPARTSHGAELASMLVYSAYCLPLDSIPVLSQRIIPLALMLELSGVFLCALGTGVAICARHYLAESWNAAAALDNRHHLVQNGPYSLCRHPIYLGFLAAVTGMILALGQARALVLLSGVMILLSKMSQEEAALRAPFPAVYPAYEQKVKRLVPWIW